MMNWNNFNSELFYGPLGRFPAALFVVASIWSVFWKGMSMWKASKNEQSKWFVALLIFNTVGVLDILYLAFFQKKGKKKKK